MKNTKSKVSRDKSIARDVVAAINFDHVSNLANSRDQVAQKSWKRI